MAVITVLRKLTVGIGAPFCNQGPQSKILTWGIQIG